MSVSACAAASSGNTFPRRRGLLPFILRLALAAALLFQGAAAPLPPWRGEVLRVSGRLLAVEYPADLPAGDLLTIVFEGDGQAHDRRGRPTNDPTSQNRPGHDLARAWPQGPVVWVGRLCQHVRDLDGACDVRDWTSHRYSAQALAAANAAVDQLKARTGAARVRLVGWSGGGVIAALLAQERDDVEGLITFASPLDLAAWTTSQRLSPLAGSLDPAARRFLAPVPQVHLLGRFDTVVAPSVLAEPASAVAGPLGAVAVRRQNHACCWRREIPYALDILAERQRRASSAISPPPSANSPR